MARKPLRRSPPASERDAAAPKGAPPAPSQWRYYIATFDLIGSRGREHQYKLADKALRFRFGEANYWKIVKQCAIIRTKDRAKDIRDVLSQQLGQKTNILVLRLRHGHAFSLQDPDSRAIAKDCFDGMPKL